MAGTFMLNGIDIARLSGILLTVIGILLLVVRYRLRVPFFYDKNQHGAMNGSLCILIGVFLASGNTMVGAIAVAVAVLCIGTAYFVFWRKNGI